MTKGKNELGTASDNEISKGLSKKMTLELMEDGGERGGTPRMKE